MFRPSHEALGLRRRVILLVALAVFCFAQALAIAHASRHLGPDAPALPGDHAQLCTDCASMLPLLVLAGGLSIAIAFLRPNRAPPRSFVAVAPRELTVTLAFRSRAPPR